MTLFSWLCQRATLRLTMRTVKFTWPAGEATLGKGDLEAKGESLYVANYAY